jgi:hypothetical protein
MDHVNAVLEEMVPDTFADQLEQRLERRLASRPLDMLSFVQTILLAKRGYSWTA